jgi:hypothetical protein
MATLTLPKLCIFSCLAPSVFILKLHHCASLFMLTSSHPMYSLSQIDLRRANNCGIMLTKVKMPLPDLMVRFYLPQLFSYYVNLLSV